MLEFEFLPNRYITACLGPDAASFLQGLITNDIRLNSLYTAMLSPKGKYLFDFFIYKSPESTYILDCGVPGLIDALSFYVLSSEVDLVDVSSKFSVVYSKGVLAKYNSIYQRDPRYSEMGFRTLLPTDAKLDAQYQENPGLYLTDKYKYAVPDGDMDMVANKSFPAEFGLHHLNGVSYTKGCYMGQELMARLRGRPSARMVYKVSAESGVNLESLAKGAPLYCNSNEVGFLCSSKGNLAIALARVGTFDKTCLLGGLEVSLSPAPWWL